MLLFLLLLLLMFLMLWELFLPKTRSTGMKADFMSNLATVPVFAHAVLMFCWIAVVSAGWVKRHEGGWGVSMGG